MTGPTAPTAPTAPARTGRRRGAFWVVAAAFATAMAFSTLPTPLYALYQRLDQFSTATVTVVFGFYAIGVLLSLFLAGHVSDWVGRRPVLVAGLLAEVASALVFLFWPALPGLLVARVICGVGVGLVTATATAYLSELSARSASAGGAAGADRADSAGRARTASAVPADIVATAANLGGLSLGPLIAGALAQYVGKPLLVPYWIVGALLAVSAVAVRLVPETVTRHHCAYHPQRVSVPADARPPYYRAAAAAFVSFGVMGLFTALAASFVAGTMHQTSHLMAGLPSFLVFFCAAAGQIALGKAVPRRLFALGIPALVVGLALTTVAVWVPSLPLFLVGGAVAGVGVGWMFKGAMSAAAALAAPESRGETAAGVFLAAYLGLTVPVVLVGIATRFVSLATAMTAFAAVVALTCGLLATRLFRPVSE